MSLSEIKNLEGGELRYQIVVSLIKGGYKLRVGLDCSAGMFFSKTMRERAKKYCETMKALFEVTPLASIGEEMEVIQAEVKSRLSEAGLDDRRVAVYVDHIVSEVA